MELYGSLLNISGSVTASTFTGSFIGDGSGLTGIQADAVVGLNLSQIATGSFTASLSPNGFNVNTDTSITGSLSVNGNLNTLSLRGYNSLFGTPSSEIVNFTVLSVSKTSNHRYFNTGSAIGYHIDGVESPFLTLLPGKTYRFFQESSNNTHQLRFYYEADRTTPYTTNVTHNGTAGQAGAYTQIVVTDTTPTVLHYQCVNHPYMGNSVQFNSNVTSFNNLTDKPTLVSGSLQINITGTTEYSTFSSSISSSIGNLSSSIATTTSGLTSDITSLSSSLTSSIGALSSSIGSSINTLSSSIATTDLNQTNRLNSIEGITGSYATTGSNVFIGTQTHSGSIIPSVDNEYDLGSLTHQWRDVFISSGSLFIDGTKVLSSTAQELIITTDTGQSIKILEGTTDSIILQTADGNLELKSSGDGDILLDPTNGKILLKGTVEVLNGNKIQSSVGGTPVVFAGDVVVSGSIELTGTIDGIDLTAFSSSVNTRVGNLESSGGNLNAFTASATTRLNSLETTTGSLNSYTSSNTTNINDIHVSTGSLNSYTSSNDSNISAIHTSTSSLNTFTSSANGRLTSLETASSSLNSYTSSNNGRVSAIETSTSSLNLFTSSINAAIELTGSNLTVRGDFLVRGTTTNVNTATLDVDNNLINLNGTGAGFAGLRIKDVTQPNLISGSFLWDSLNDKWIAGQLGSEDDVVLLSKTQSLSNKTISGASNTLTNIGNGSLTNSSISIAGNTISLGGTISTATILTSTGVISGSVQVVASLPSGSVSGSSQVLNGTTIHSGSFFNGITVVSGSGQISFNGITDKPTLVSGSSQISYTGLVNIPSDIVSGSSQISFNGITDKPTLVSGSVQIDLTATTNYSSGIKTRLNAEGVISGSSQVTGIGNPQLVNPSFHVGTTSISLGRASASQTLTGVSIDGNSANVTGVVAIANGGTGASDAATARTNLGLAIGTNVLAQRTFGTAANNNTGDFAAFNAVHFVGTTSIAANRASAAQTLTGVSIDGNSANVTGIVAIANGGTGASDAATARTNLGITFANVSSKPTTLSGYGITDAYPLSGNPSSFITGISFANVSSKPTTLSGYGITDALTNNTDSEQNVGLKGLYYNDGVKRVSSDPRWNESGYDGDLGTLHIYSTTAAGANYGRAGIALYNGSAYQYLTTKSGLNNLYINNNIAIHAGNVSSYAVTSLTDTLATVTGRGASTSTTITSTINGTAFIMNGGGSAEGISMQATNNTTYPVFLRSRNPSGGGETSAWLFKEESTPWGIWHNNPVNAFDFTRASTTGIENNVGGGTNTVMIRLNTTDGSGQFTGNIFNRVGTTILDQSGNIPGNSATVSNGVYTTGDQTISGTKTFNGTHLGIENGTNVWKYIRYRTGGSILWDIGTNEADDGASYQIRPYGGSTNRMTLSLSGVLTVSGNILPLTNNSFNLGSPSVGWANIYTNDLHLSNMNKPEGNDVDGTNGTWTIQEGAENLYIINNNNGKKFKIKLEEV